MFETVRLGMVPRAGVEPSRPCGQRIFYCALLSKIYDFLVVKGTDIHWIPSRDTLHDRSRCDIRKREDESH